MSAESLADQRSLRAANSNKKDKALPAGVFYKHGAYYLVRNNRWIRLGPDKQCVPDAIRAVGIAATLGGIYTPQEIAELLKATYRSRKAKAKQEGIDFTLTFEDLMDIAKRSNGVCEVSGTPFSWGNAGYTTKRPFMPSLDRIVPSRGYTKENCRMVCLCTKKHKIRP